MNQENNMRLLPEGDSPRPGVWRCATANGARPWRRPIFPTGLRGPVTAIPRAGACCWTRRNNRRNSWRAANIIESARFCRESQIRYEHPYQNKKGPHSIPVCTCQVKVDTKKSISTGSPVRSCTELGFYSPKPLLDAGC